MVLNFQCIGRLLKLLRKSCTTVQAYFVVVARNNSLLWCFTASRASRPIVACAVQAARPYSHAGRAGAAAAAELNPGNRLIPTGCNPGQTAP